MGKLVSCYCDLFQTTILEGRFIRIKKQVNQKTIIIFWTLNSELQNKVHIIDADFVSFDARIENTITWRTLNGLCDSISQASATE